MKNTLTRSELLDAQNAFDCKKWTRYIQNILDSTKDKTIEISDKYLDLIKQEAIWDQILYCKALNLDLKMKLPQEAKEFVLEKITVCQVTKKGKFRTLYQENRKNLFILDSKNMEFWLDDEIYKVLQDKYTLKLNEILELMNSILEEHFKVMGYTYTPYSC